MKRIALPKNLALAAAILAGASFLTAADYTWSPSSGTNYGDGVWDTSTSNWITSGSTASWVNGAHTAKFPSGAAGSAQSSTITLGSNITLQAIDMGGSYGGDVVIKNSGVNNYTLSLGGSAYLANNNTSKTLTIEAVVTGNSGLKKTNAGTVVLANRYNTYTGKTDIQGGTLKLVTSDTRNNLATSSEISLVSAARLDVTGIGHADGFTLASGQTLNGTGTVLGNVTVASGARLAGSLTFNNNLALATGSATDLTLTSLTTFDQVKSGTGSQTVTFGGTLNLAFGAGFASTGSLQLFNFESFAGSFSHVAITGLAEGYTATFDAASGKLNIATAIPEPAAFAIMLGAGALAARALLVRRQSSSR